MQRAEPNDRLDRASPLRSPPGEPSAGSLDSGKEERVFFAEVRGKLLAPASAIQQVSQLLLQESCEDLPPDFHSDLNKIHEAGNRLLELVREFVQVLSTERAHDPKDLHAIYRQLKHDARNALNAVINYSELWLEEGQAQLPSGRLKDLQTIHQAGKNCLALIDQPLRHDEPGMATDEENPGHSITDPSIGQWLTTQTATAPRIKGRILVVDDNETNRIIFDRHLRQLGHHVQRAADGRQALDLLETEAVDLILLDILMPELNGFEVLQQLKADPRWQDIPVLMISALDDLDGVVRCIAMGAEDYNPKPVQPLLLQARVNACLEKKRLRDREILYLEEIERERKRADDLLHVILPHAVVEELKSNGTVQPRSQSNVGVLFADIVGFTPYCSQHAPADVLHHLQQVVERWEEITLQHGVQKIKTIGDALMAVAGALEPVANPVERCVRCGLEMIAAVAAEHREWKLRVGVHVGSVITGVLGRRQYLFDLWGDTVNLAARMESHGIAGAIMLSPDAWHQIAARAKSRPHPVQVKGKGEMILYEFLHFTS